MDSGLAAGLAVTPLLIYYITTIALFYRNALRGDYPQLQHQLPSILINAVISCFLVVQHTLILLQLNSFCASEVAIIHILMLLHVTIYWVRATENTLDVFHYVQRSLAATDKTAGYADTAEGPDKTASKQQDPVQRAPGFGALAKILRYLEESLPKGRVRALARNPWNKDSNPVTAKTRRLSVIQVASFSQGSSQTQMTTRLTATNIGKLTVVFGLIFVVLILIALLPIPSAEATRSTCFRGEPYIGLYVFILVLQLLVFWFQTVRRNKDRKRFNEFVWVSSLITFSTIMSMSGDLMTRLGWPGGVYFRAGFVACGLFGCHAITTLLPVIREWMQKGEDIQFTPLYFETVLNDPKLFAEFKQALKDDFCIENGVFYEEASAIAVVASQLPPKLSPDDPPSPDEIQLQEKVQGICRKYVFPGSPSELNIPSTVRKMVKADLENGKADFSTLAPVVKEVCQMMYRNNFQKFVNKKRAELQKSKA